MVLEVKEKDSMFRVKWQEFSQEFSIDWLPDTSSNRKSVIIFLRLLRDENGKPLFTFQELSAIVGSEKRQASSQYVEDFRESGRDFLQFLKRKRKIDSEVTEAVRLELQNDPLAETSELQQRVNAQLKQKGISKDISSANIGVALDQVSSQEIRSAVKKQIDKGEAHYREEYLLGEMMKSSDNSLGKRAGIRISQSEDLHVSDPTSIRKLVTPGIALSSIWKPLKLIVLCMVLYYFGVPLSMIGRWFGVSKTTILRRILGLSLALWPIVYGWIVANVKGRIVYIDEKWLKIQKKWHYWFVVLDAETGLPVLASLLGTKSQWACRWIGVKLRELGKLPKVIITDGLKGYHSVMEGVIHVLCHFHHQQGVARWLKKHFSNEKDISARKPKMKKVIQTKDKRTVKRRLSKLKEDTSIKEWVEQTEGNLSVLLPSVGSRRIPRTTNAIERFFRAFNRFYKLRCGFHSVLSAGLELIFFMLVYVFVQQEDGRAPIESIMPEAIEMPLYKLINDPLRSALEVENVNKKVRLADFEPQQCLAA